MSFREVIRAIHWDLKRAQYHFNRPALGIILLSPGFQAVAAYRLCRWLNSHLNPKNPVTWPILILQAIFIRIVEIITGIHINLDARIEPGLLIIHFGCIVIGEQVVIGRNCDIHQGVTLGYGGRGASRGGYPEIGSRVYIAPGAKVIGKIKIGDDVAIGANAVVTKSVPDRATVVGIPAKVISTAGSFEFVGYPGMKSDPDRQASLAQRDLVSPSTDVCSE